MQSAKHTSPAECCCPEKGLRMLNYGSRVIYREQLPHGEVWVLLAEIKAKHFVRALRNRRTKRKEKCVITILASTTGRVQSA